MTWLIVCSANLIISASIVVIETIVSVINKDGFEGLMMMVLKYRDIKIDGKLYMRRFYLSPEIFGWQARIHHIFLSDLDRDPHDHPYDFWSMILRGSYVETLYPRDMCYKPFNHIYPDEICNCWKMPRNLWRSKFQMVFRKAEQLHRLTVPKSGVWTLLIAGPTRREWGYQTPDGWISHKHYHNYLVAIGKRDE